MPVSVIRDGPIHANHVWTGANCVEPSNWATIGWEAQMTFHVIRSAAAATAARTAMLYQNVRIQTTLIATDGECEYIDTQKHQVFPLANIPTQDIYDSHSVEDSWGLKCDDDVCCAIDSVITGRVRIISGSHDGHPLTPADVGNGNQGVDLLVQTVQITKNKYDISYRANDKSKAEDGYKFGSYQQAYDEYSKHFDLHDIKGEGSASYGYHARVEHCKQTAGVMQLGQSAEVVGMRVLRPPAFGGGGGSAVAVVKPSLAVFAASLGPMARPFVSHLSMASSGQRALSDGRLKLAFQDPDLR